jgi:hypothetical protein
VGSKNHDLSRHIHHCCSCWKVSSYFHISMPLQSRLRRVKQLPLCSLLMHGTCFSPTFDAALSTQMLPSSYSNTLIPVSVTVHMCCSMHRSITIAARLTSRHCWGNDLHAQCSDCILRQTQHSMHDYCNLYAKCMGMLIATGTVSTASAARCQCGAWSGCADHCILHPTAAMANIIASRYCMHGAQPAAPALSGFPVL